MFWPRVAHNKRFNVMFHYFFDDRIYAEDLLVDVFKVECLWLGVATIQFSCVSPPSREELWRLLVRYCESLEALPDNVRPRKDVYEMLLHDQFESYYSYFSNKENLNKMHINMRLINEKRHLDSVFGNHLKLMGKLPLP